MSRGGGWLLAGLLLMFAGYGVEAMLLEAVADKSQKKFPSKSEEDARDAQLRMLWWWQWAKIGGVIATSVGISLLLVDRGRHGVPPPNEGRVSECESVPPGSPEPSKEDNPPVV